MRVLAIGLGGAGARIVDTLYGQDLRGSIHCMSALAVDFDIDTLMRLKYLPSTGRIHFPPIDPTAPYDVETTIDIVEVMTQIQQVDTIEIDSILIFAGLGGSMVDAAPLIIPELRKSFIEPIFAVVTLPCGGEGKKRSAKAADDIEKLKPLVDAVVLFDNDTWYRRIKDELAITVEKVAKREIPKRLAKKILQQPLNRKEYIHNLLNTHLARQMGLILHAGEFSEEGVGPQYPGRDGPRCDRIRCREPSRRVPEVPRSLAAGELLHPDLPEQGLPHRLPCKKGDL
jgi:hypothetical protein